MNTALIIAVFVNLVCSTVGDVFSKLWGITNNNNWFYAGLGINIFTQISYMCIVRFGGLAIATSFVLIVTILISVLLGVLVFKEQVALQQYVGICLGLLSTILILNLVKF